MRGSASSNDSWSPPPTTAAIARAARSGSETRYETRAIASLSLTMPSQPGEGKGTPARYHQRRWSATDPGPARSDVPRWERGGRRRTGGGDHFQVTVGSAAFEGLWLVEQHRLVNRALAEPLNNGPIHELRISTKGRHDAARSDPAGDRGEPVAVFMKGTPERPACGNSLRALQALWSAGAPITAVDVLPDPRIRQSPRSLGMANNSQVFVKGELIGGDDITEEPSPGASSAKARRGARGGP